MARSCGVERDVKDWGDNVRGGQKHVWVFLAMGVTVAMNPRTAASASGLEQLLPVGPACTALCSAACMPISRSSAECMHYSTKTKGNKHVTFDQCDKTSQ